MKAVRDKGSSRWGQHEGHHIEGQQGIHPQMHPNGGYQGIKQDDRHGEEDNGEEGPGLVRLFKHMIELGGRIDRTIPMKKDKYIRKVQHKEDLDENHLLESWCGCWEITSRCQQYKMRCVSKS